MNTTSTWFALRNPVFRRLWLASVLSGTFVSAQDMAATWLMHDLGGSSLALSLMATAASAPFFLFTLPAGAVADIANRRVVIVIAVLWQAACSGLLALGAWTGMIDPNLVLVCIFLLGLGVAFYAPVWGAIVPDIADKDELASAITLGGVQLNLSGIVGPALAGLLLPLLGVSVLISFNAVAFLAVALAVWQWRPRQEESPRSSRKLHRILYQFAAIRAPLARHEGCPLQERAFFARYLNYTGALARDCAQGDAAFRCSAGVCLYMSGGGVIGRSSFRASLPEGEDLGERNHVDFHGDNDCRAARIGFPALTARFDALRISCGSGLVAGWIRTLGGRTARDTGMGARTDERVPDHARARRHCGWCPDMGVGCSASRSQMTFAAAAILALAVLAIGHRISIDFAAEASVDAAPLQSGLEFPGCPDHDDGPVTVTIKYTIAKKDREKFYALMQGVQASIRRNGAFDCRLDESLDHPGQFRLEFQLSTWADHLRQTNRMTVDDQDVFNDAWDLHAADSNPIVHYYVSSQKCVFPNNFGFAGRTFSTTSTLPKRKPAVPRPVAAS